MASCPNRHLWNEGYESGFIQCLDVKTDLLKKLADLPAKQQGEPQQDDAVNERPNIKDFFPKGTDVKNIHDLFIQNKNWYGYMVALDHYIDEKQPPPQVADAEKRMEEITRNSSNAFWKDDLRPPQLTGEAVYDEINALLKIYAGFDMEHPTTHRVCRAIADLVYKYSSHPVEITYGAIEEFWTDKMRWQGMGFSVAQEKLAKRIIRAAIKKFSHPTQLLSEDRMVEIIGKHIRVASGDLREGVREALVEMKGR
jgi:hypothetical protein